MNWFMGMFVFILALVLTPVVKKLSIYWGVTDQPDARKVHQGLMPRMGGLAIAGSFFLGVYWFGVPSQQWLGILIGAGVITLTGMVDDKWSISPKWKLLGQLIGAGIAVWMGELYIQFVELPFMDGFTLGMWSIPVSILWIVGITNAVNLIDGLDGLAAGVSSISLITIIGLSLANGNVELAMMALMLLASTLGFLVFNFPPAKIFMGDTGSLFLGFMIGSLSVMDFKEVTFFSYVVPLLVLMIPIGDTLFAIIRRVVNKKPISAPDKNHFHHGLLRLGYSHKKSVLIIYLVSAVFSLGAILLAQNVVWLSFIVLGVAFVLIEFGVEKVGLIHQNYTPMISVWKKMRSLSKRG